MVSRKINNKNIGKSWYNGTWKSYQSQLLFIVVSTNFFVVVSKSVANHYLRITIGDKKMLGNIIR